MARAVAGTRKLKLEGRGPLVLHAADHVATGGEGSVFRRGDTAIKLYADPDAMSQSGMADKIGLLSRLAHPYVVSPKGLVFEGGSNPVGFWMPYAEGEPLPRLFTNDYRGRVGFSDGMANVLVERMREAVAFIHGQGVTMVDGNELNYLAWLGGLDGPEPRLIDVDSWMIGRFGAKVIMPSIRDWHNQGFGTGSDWFAWAIVTFQIFTGIHPYKGTADGFDRADLESRMRANVSIFHNGVRVNRAVRDPATIPAALRGWYEEVFEAGLRAPPPSPFATSCARAAVPALRHVATTQQGGLVFEKLFERAGEPVLRVFPCGVALVGGGALVDLSSGRRISDAAATDVEIVSAGDGWLIGEAGAFRFVARDGTDSPLASPVAGSRVVRAAGRLFVAGEALTEVRLTLLGGKPFLSAGGSWGVMPHAIRWFDGVGVQDTLGSAWLVVPFGDKSCAQVRVPELDRIVPLGGVAGKHYAVLVGRDAAGGLQRCEFSFDADFRAYRFVQDTVDTPEVNVAVLPKGVCAGIAQDGELAIFVPSTGDTRRVADRNVTTMMVLAAWNDWVVYVKDGALWRVRMT